MGLRTETEADHEPRPPITPAYLRSQLRWHEDGMAEQMHALLRRLDEPPEVRQSRRARHAWHAAHVAPLRLRLRQMEMTP